MEYLTLKYIQKLDEGSIFIDWFHASQPFLHSSGVCMVGDEAHFWGENSIFANIVFVWDV